MARLMPCGHPRAAQMIECKDGTLRTTCWACKVEKPDNRRKEDK